MPKRESPEPRPAGLRPGQRRLAPSSPDVIRRIISGREPADVSRYVMQARDNVVYVAGSGVIDLRQFSFGVGRHLVDEPQLPDHNIYITLDEYLVQSNRRQLGFSASSKEIAQLLLGQYSKIELLMALVALNRIRKKPDELAFLEKIYVQQLPQHAAAVYRGIMSQGEPSRFFLARQLILLALREVLLYDGPITDRPLRDAASTAVMLTHAIGSDLQYTGGGTKLWEGMSSGDLMGIVQNGSFHSADDPLALLDRHWRIWFEVGASGAKQELRSSFDELAREAIGMDARLALAIGLALRTNAETWKSGTPLIVQSRFLTDVDEEDMNAFLTYTSTTLEALSADFVGTSGPWSFLPLERSPILRLGDQLLVLDESYLLSRITDGLYYAVADIEGPPSGSARRRAWSRAYSEVVEVALERRIETLAPTIPVLGDGSMKTYFSEEDIRAAYVPKGKRGQGHKVCDAAVWVPSQAWLLFEVVNGELKLPTRQGGDMDEFARDTDRLVIDKLRQLDATAADIALNESKLSQLPLTADPIQPILIQGGHFPIHPVTIAYIEFRMKQESVLSHRARVHPLAILHWDELEVLEAIVERGESVMGLLSDWQKSSRRAMPLKNWITVSRSDIERPRRLRDGHRLREILDAAASRRADH